MRSPAEFSACPHCSITFTADPQGQTLEAKNAFLALSAHISEHHAEGMFRCPRQGESRFGGLPTEKMAFWESDGTCSYCGSLSPELFFEAVERGDEIEPTDKSYKAYVKRPNPEAGQTVRTGSHSGPVVDRNGHFTISDPTPEEIAAGRFDRITMGPAPATTHDKFYFQHLDGAGQDRFIELVNAKKMNIGYPGHFYSRPFFCAPANSAAAE
jgi:hypothetical protein